MMKDSAIDRRIAEKDQELERIREAFALFEDHSRLLQVSFDKLQKDLARANSDLNAKNQALSQKVDELEQLSSRLHYVLESLTDGVLVIGGDMSVERCNPAAERLLGRSQSEVVGRKYGRDANGLSNVDAVRQALEEGRTLRDQPRSSGGENERWLDVLASVAPIKASDGTIIGAVEVLRDVTDFRALEAQLRHQERMAALGEMAASVAHEIRNPLGTIEGFARLLRRDVAEHPDYLRLADKIVEGTQNLNYVITNLLTYVRPMSLQCEKFDAAQFFYGIQEGLEAKAEARGVELDFDPGEGNRSVTADSRQLRQVLLNLGINAIEACEKNGKVAVSFRRSGKDAIFVVKDNGCGIDLDDASRIFDPFFTTKQGGTGLGLSLCHKIISAHNGKIDVESDGETGTSFIVVLPDEGEPS